MQALCLVVEKFIKLYLLLIDYLYLWKTIMNINYAKAKGVQIIICICLIILLAMITSKNTI